MGLFDKTIEKQKQQKLNTLNEFLLEGEEIEYFFDAKEDFGAITNKRLLFLDRGVTSSKKAIISIPFSKISSVGMGWGGFLSISKNILIYVGSQVFDIDTWDISVSKELYRRISIKIV